MKLIIVLSATLLAVKAQPTLYHYTEFAKFKVKHGKSYTPNEDLKRVNIFSQNLAKIELHNERYAQGKETYTMAVNQFTDLTHEELIPQRSSVRKQNRSIFKTISVDPNIYISKSIDWRQEGAVTPVKNQGTCSSCWAFSAAGALEGLNFLQTRKLVSFSAQELIDCSIYFNNDGCDGGWIENAFDYVIHNGITTQKKYPYKEKDSVRCKKRPNHNQTIISSFGAVKSFDEDELMYAVATIGPIAVSVHASDDWDSYHKGVYSNGQCQNTSTFLTHSVLVVGYGNENGLDYWLVKNSWGETFGDDGYIKIARNQGNTCGIASEAFYPIP